MMFKGFRRRFQEFRRVTGALRKVREGNREFPMVFQEVSEHFHRVSETLQMRFLGFLRV